MRRFQLAIPGSQKLNFDEGLACSILGPLGMKEDYWARESSSERAVPAGATLFSQDTTCTHVHLVVSGLVKLVHDAPSADRTILGLRSQGCVLGLATAVLGGSYQCTAIAVADTIISSRSLPEFRALMLADVHFLHEVNRLLSREIRTEEEQEVEMRLGDVPARLTRLIVEFNATLKAEKEKSANAIQRGAPSAAETVSLRQNDIAQMLSITPAHLSRLLHRMPNKEPDVASELEFA